MKGSSSRRTRGGRRARTIGEEVPDCKASGPRAARESAYDLAALRGRRRQLPPRLGHPFGGVVVRLVGQVVAAVVPLLLLGFRGGGEEAVSHLRGHRLVVPPVEQEQRPPGEE